ncbi:MAG TPA: ABC transporter permease subunit [Anaerolineales bacterium]
MTANHLPPKEKTSILHGLLSFLVPGLGQLAAGYPVRGFSLLISIILLGLLSIWTIAQRARFPDFGLSAKVFILLVAQSGALLLFLIALRYLVGRFALKDVSGQALTQVGLGIIYVLAIVLVADSFLSAAGSEEELRQVFGMPAVLSAAALASIWFWQAFDAARIGGRQAPASLTPAILIACLLIFVLGWNITKIDMPKAVREYQDTQIILRRIIWPWRAAFEFTVRSLESEARIQAPCPEGASGPPVNEPQDDEPWIVVIPTCGEISERDLRGNFEPGSELTITGGNFSPGTDVEILWKNPIGNPFRPRGVGETVIPVDESGGFETKLNIPEAVIPATAMGDQIHTLIVRQESALVFTGALSREMKLALVGMLETIMLGLMATFFGIILAVPFSFLAARNLMSPIVTTLSGVVGGLVLLVPAVAIAFFVTGRIAGLMGGLDDAPLQTASVALLLVTALGWSGWKAGSRGMQYIGERAPDTFSRLVTSAVMGLLTAIIGYILGIGFSRGIRSIPLGQEVAVLTEMRYAIAGAVIFGLAGLVYAYRKGIHGEISIGMIVYVIVRTLMNIIRSIEPLIWALVGIIWIGPGPFAGAIALTVHTIASLGKLYSESIESINPGPIEAIQATGATRLQSIMYAVVPQVLPPFISFTIYRWDINVRLSTIIGLVGGGGIGFILIQWIRQFQYEPAGIAVWLITITVAVLDYVSSEIRERFV